VATGPVLRRAGDLFGLPVNLAQVLTKAAPSGTVLVTAAVAAELRDVPGGEPAQVPGPGDQPVDVVSLRA
jgi:class 3 adenylate cyclase